MSEKEKVDKAVELYNQGKYKEAIDAFSSVLETCLGAVFGQKSGLRQARK